MQPMKTVLIKADGKVKDTDRVVSVSKIRNENIRWVALNNGGPWKVTFDKNVSGSPFTRTRYDVPQGGEVISAGGPTAGALGRTYAYNVRDANGIIKDDPDVDVE
jgi:hypothetical protein